MVLSTMLTGFESSARIIGESVNIQATTIVSNLAEKPISIEPKVEYVSPYTDEEIDLLALLTMAEAEGESEQGKRLVIDTVLNRVDHSYWPDTIHGVIYQSGQFTSMWNGRVNRCYVTDEIRELVVEEMRSRTNTDVVYFTAGGYGKYGTRLFNVGNHYFAAY